MKFAWIVEPPFNFRTGSEITGCDVELARRVFMEIGEEFEPVETDFAQLLAGLQDGRWDVTTGMFITPKRTAVAHFTAPIWALRDGLLVRKGREQSIKGYRTLAESGGKLAVLKGQVQRQSALANGIAASSVHVFREYREAAEAVGEGIVDAYASVELAHFAHIANTPAQEFACVPVPGNEKNAERGGFACRTSIMRDRMNEVLREFLGSQAHRQMLEALGLSTDAVAVK